MYTVVVSSAQLTIRHRYKLYNDTARTVRGTGSMKRYGVRPSVCVSQQGPTAANPLLDVRCCGPGGQEISIDCSSSDVRWANACSATLSAYVGS